MTTRKFVCISDFRTDELTINVISWDVRAEHLTVTDIVDSNEEVFDREILSIDFITSGDNSAESYLDITIFV